MEVILLVLMETFTHQKNSIFARVYISMVVIVIFLLKEKIYKFKAKSRNTNFPNQFCLGSTSNKFDDVEAEQAS